MNTLRSAGALLLPMDAPWAGGATPRTGCTNLKQLTKELAVTHNRIWERWDQHLFFFCYEIILRFTKLQLPVTTTLQFSDVPSLWQLEQSWWWTFTGFLSRAPHPPVFRGPHWYILICLAFMFLCKGMALCSDIPLRSDALHRIWKHLSHDPLVYRWHLQRWLWCEITGPHLEPCERGERAVQAASQSPASPGAPGQRGLQASVLGSGTGWHLRVLPLKPLGGSVALCAAQERQALTGGLGVLCALSVCRRRRAHSSAPVGW